MKTKSYENKIYVPEHLYIKVESYIYNHNLDWNFIVEKALLRYYNNRLNVELEERNRNNASWKRKNSKIIKVKLNNNLTRWISRDASFEYTSFNTITVNSIENYLISKNLN